MKAIMFTPAEAAALTGLSVKEINKAIETKAVFAKVVRLSGVRKRYVTGAGLVCLDLEAKGLRLLPLSARKKVFQQILKAPHVDEIREVEAIVIDVKSARTRIAIALRDLRRAERMVSTNPEIMCGVPVFRRTRVPVHLVAEMMAQGASPEEILAGYPSLTKERVRLASLYARAHPRRGRPPVQPWSGQKPVRHVRLLLPSAAA